MRVLTSSLMLSLVLLGLLQVAQAHAVMLDDMLVVYIGAHPDDIDIGMSSSLFKFDVNNHPILWIVATDGGADRAEYDFEVNEGWVSQDGIENCYWPIPYSRDQYVTRDFYSGSLSKKRCGGYLDEINGVWIAQQACHNSSFGDEWDWRSRVSLYVGSTVVEKLQMYYNYYTIFVKGASGPRYVLRYALYPDSSLADAESSFQNSLAQEIAKQINRVVVLQGYRKDLLCINAHAPEEVARNADEHSDHRITGNAVRIAIDYLHNNYGFGEIGATWFTIYNPIEPQPGYTRYTENISQDVQIQKSNLCKACWETDYIYNTNPTFLHTWVNFHYDPGDCEYVVCVNYYA